MGAGHTIDETAEGSPQSSRIKYELVGVRLGMSAFGGKADVDHSPAEGQFVAISSHWWLHRNLLFPITASEIPDPV